MYRAISVCLIAAAYAVVLAAATTPLPTRQLADIMKLFTSFGMVVIVSARLVYKIVSCWQKRIVD